MEAVNLPCSTCRHFYRLKSGCKAFPRGIPDAIWSGENDHRERLPRQKTSIVYEKGEPDEFKELDSEK